ncbi:sulfonate/nitrate/taurine transport system permease domain protein [Burkholderia thailandensis]|uniref:Sulfonate/nitrate/taurine transport system permease domain protein n=1 Tax=Burkholderia thailandensis TaxID=57975 RepID=A0AAW9D106_BURTH|nr:sulfonate/nitrate/taurine transport system permease domain protein [Burkholderia thailandensis]MDW9255043.1 sulfonate/nitrate/taurine transport system permease domain protein [Burkholderia thailandensis]
MAVIRPRHGQPAVRARACGALAARVERVRGLSDGARDALDASAAMTG